jgi:hypothetical protein
MTGTTPDPPLVESIRKTDAAKQGGKRFGMVLLILGSGYLLAMIGLSREWDLYPTGSEQLVSQTSW